MGIASLVQGNALSFAASSSTLIWHCNKNRFVILSWLICKSEFLVVKRLWVDFLYCLQYRKLSCNKFIFYHFLYLSHFRINFDHCRWRQNVQQTAGRWKCILVLPKTLSVVVVRHIFSFCLSVACLGSLCPMMILTLIRKLEMKGERAPVRYPHCQVCWIPSWSSHNKIWERSVQNNTTPAPDLWERPQK